MTEIIPGRGDLRISLTSACNLKCSYCHNEGQEFPWATERLFPSLSTVYKMIALGEKHGAKSVKFTGGDPGVYPHIIKLLEFIPGWKAEFSGTTKWGMATNGVPFINPRKFNALVTSSLDNISIGIDSVSDFEYSKPSSPSGISGGNLIRGFVIPLKQNWDGQIKFDTVFTGNKTATTEVVDKARELSIYANVIEVYQSGDVRNSFLELIDETAKRHRLEKRLYEFLNEWYLFDKNDNPVIKFYQDHCVGLDCDSCRKIHLRVVPNGGNFAAVPCFVRARTRTIPITDSLDDAIIYNSKGPEWYMGTKYE